MNEQEIRQGYASLTKLLIQKKLTIATMESATAGQIASLITDIQGASAIFKGGFITYCNEAKIKHGVPAEIIKKYSVYSKETALAMAKACQKSFETDIGIGVTGTMGNVDPANEAASVPGQVYFAILFCGKSYSFFYEIPVQPSRLAYKLQVAAYILKELYEIINELSR